MLFLITGSLIASSSLWVTLPGWAFCCVKVRDKRGYNIVSSIYLETKKQKNYQVFQAVFPAFHMGEHVMLQAGDSTEFAEVVGLDALSGAAVLPHILKTYRHSGH